MESLPQCQDQDPISSPKKFNMAQKQNQRQQHKQQSWPRHDSQSSNSLTLVTPDLQKLNQGNPQGPPEKDQNKEHEITNTPVFPPITETNTTTTSAIPSCVKLLAIHEKKAQKRHKIFVETTEPFMPVKTLDFSSNKNLLETIEECVDEEDNMDFEESEEEEPEQWILHGNNDVANHVLEQSNIEGDDRGTGFQLSREGLTWTNLLAAMEAGQIPLNSGLQGQQNTSNVEFLASRVDTQTVPRGSLHSGNGNDMSYNSHHVRNKRMNDGSWYMRSSEFVMCMEQIQHWMGKATMMYQAEEKACEQLSINQQSLLYELLKRDDIIEDLNKARLDEEQKRQAEISRLEHELHQMGNLLEGYRKALYKTHRQFAEYRVRCPLPYEPLYKDVGSEGLVMSTMELEEQRLKQQREEEEERIKRSLIEEMVRDIEREWLAKFETHKDRIRLMDDRLINVEKEVRFLQDLFAKRKLAEMSESTSSEE